MKIAIIENDLGRISDISGVAARFHWEIETFKDPKEFGGVDLSSYDVVVADCSLPTMNGRDLIKSISGKTNAQLFLMSDSSGNFSEEDIENDNINGLIDKDQPYSLIDHLKYVDSKIRINRLMEQETERMNGILSNGHSLEVQDGVGILEIKKLPVNMDRVREELSGVKGLVVFFSDDEKMVTSAHLGVLVSVYKLMRETGRKMSFWNKSGHEYVEKMMKDCNLDNLFGIYRSIDDAKGSLSSTTHG